MVSPKGLVFRIQRHSLHDGPGIRTLVFLKGCPLRCVWCFNPESQEPKPEVLHYPEKCIGCDLCLKVCPINGAIEVRDGQRTINRHRCNNCGECATACPTGGMTRIGSFMEVDEVVDIVERDGVFYEKSGGGVTLTGGEATFQGSFAREVLRTCKRKGIHTALETCGYTDWVNLERLLIHTDLLLYDLKIMDGEKHREYTGIHNERILKNAARAARSGIPMIIRIPVIPGYTDAEVDLEEAAEFISSTLPEIEAVHLLPYELFGVTKYERLGREYILADVEPPSNEHLVEIRDLFQRYGMKTQIGG